MHILVVDDTASVLQITEKMLHTAGHEVTCVGSGAGALQTVVEHEFNLVLMDAVMEKMSGLEAARAIRIIRPSLPIVYMTGFPDQLEALHGKIVIEKPFTVERLLAVVEKFGTKPADEQGAAAWGTKD